MVTILVGVGGFVFGILVGRKSKKTVEAVVAAVEAEVNKVKNK